MAAIAWTLPQEGMGGEGRMRDGEGGWAIGDKRKFGEPWLQNVGDGCVLVKGQRRASIQPTQPMDGPRGPVISTLPEMSALPGSSRSHLLHDVVGVALAEARGLQQVAHLGLAAGVRVRVRGKGADWGTPRAVGTYRRVWQATASLPCVMRQDPAAAPKGSQRKSTIPPILVASQRP